MNISYVSVGFEAASTRLSSTSHLKKSSLISCLSRSLRREKASGVEDAPKSTEELRDDKELDVIWQQESATF